MSDPSRAFQDLNLDDMPVTRSQARAAQRGRGRDRTPIGIGRTNPIARPSRPTRPSGPGRTDSPLSEMHRAPPSASSAPAPMSHPTFSDVQALFRVENIIRESRHIDFHLRSLDNISGPVIERLVYDSAHGNHAAYCNHAEHRNSRSPCNHMKWLVAGLTRELLNPAGMQPTTSETIREQIGHLYPLVARQMQPLRTRLNASRRIRPDGESSSSSEEESSDDESQFGSMTNVLARQNELCDILTSFHEDMLPRDFHQKYVQATPAVILYRDCLVEDDLYASLYRLGMRDRYVFRALQNLVPNALRAVKVYRKQEARGIRALDRLDERSRRGFLDPINADLPRCAMLLRSIVHEIYEDLQTRFAAEAIDQRVSGQTAASLIHLVEEVVKRRYRDYYEGYGNLPASLTKQDRNIFAFLISDPPPPPREGVESWQTNLFVVDRLSQTQWIELYDHLDTIMHDIRESTDESEPAAVRYTDQIAGLLNDYNQTYDDPSSSSTRVRMPRPNEDA